MPKYDGFDLDIQNIKINNSNEPMSTQTAPTDYSCQTGNANCITIIGCITHTCNICAY